MDGKPFENYIDGDVLICFIGSKSKRTTCFWSLDALAVLLLPQNGQLFAFLVQLQLLQKIIMATLHLFECF